MGIDWTLVVVFWAIGLCFFALEVAVPARPLSYRAVLLNDLLALGTYNALFFIGAQLTDRIPIPDYVHGRLAGVPFLVKLGLFLLLVDFGAYWVHRLMHVSWVWRIHKWHHSPHYLYWLAGIRSSFLQILLTNIPFVLLLPLLQPLPQGFFLAYFALLIVTNNWMHMNVRWQSNWLEWVFVTPRFHHIHHSEDPKHYTSNLGVWFTFWDRLFGTYQDPERISRDITFGIGERINPVRLAIGL